MQRTRKKILLWYYIIMPLTFASGQGVPTYKSAAYSNLFITPIVISSITSTVAGQIVVVWTGGLGNNVKYSYALSVSGATATISSSNTTSSSGTNTTTLTLSTTATVTTTVTVTGTVLDGSGSATSGSITTQTPISAFSTPVATAGAAGAVSITWTGGSGTGVTYTYTVKRGGAVITTGFTVSGTAPNITFTFTDTTSYSYTFAVTATAGAATLTSSESASVQSSSPIILSTASGATPLIAYIFTANYYTSINGTSGYYRNMANPGTDSFYVFNSLTSGTNTSSTYTFKYLNFSTNSGTNYRASTAPKGSIGNNNTAYSNTISSITASTSFTSFTITYWIYVTGGDNAIWNRFGLIGDQHNYQIYDQKGGVENANNSATRTLNDSTWTFVATTLTGETLYLWSCAVGNTFPSSSISVSKGSFSQGVNANTVFIFGSTQWNDGNATFYLADLRIYGSALSQSDLRSMFTSGPITG